MSDPVFVIARVTVRPDARETFVAAGKACIAETRQEPGCLGYDLYESVGAPGSLVFVERWVDRAAIDHHFTLPHLHALLAVAGTCVTAPPVIEVVEPRSIARL